jgi:hypothetical protein
MIKRMLTAASVTLILSSGFAQNNTIYLELLGNGLVYSLNYDRMVTDNISVRAGYGGLTISERSSDPSGFGIITEEIKITMIPVLANYLRGEGKHKLEIGGGIVLVSLDYTGNVADVDFSLGADGAIPTANLGYRYQKPEGGFFFKASLCPFFAETMVTSAGLGLGYSF